MAETYFRHSTANLFKDLSLGPVEGELATVAQFADVMGVQEVNSNAHRIAVNGMTNKGWGLYWPGGSPTGVPQDANQIPILWRTSVFVLLGKGTQEMHGSGQGSPSRHISWVILKAKSTGEIVVRMNTHFIHQAWTSHPERQDQWLTHEKKMLAKAHDLAAQYGSVIGGGDINRDHYIFPDAYNYYTTDGTFGGARYDLLFVVGKYLEHGTFNTVATQSDHDAVVGKFEGIEKKKVPVRAVEPTAEPKPVQELKLLPPIPSSIGLVRSRWRYIAQRLTGDGGTGDFVSFDLPLRDVEYGENLSGFNSITAKISPALGAAKDQSGRPLLEEWGTAIFVENDGEIRAGGIVNHSGFQGPEWSIECIGYAGYSQGMPWVTSDANNYLGVEVDPMDVVRVVWNHIQTKPNGNIGLEIDTLRTGLKIGTKLDEVEFDTQSGPVSFEAGPVQINWYTDHDLSQTLNTLATNTPFDWRERHYWDGDVIRHRLEFGYPKLGVRRDDLRFVVGENIDPIPIDRDGNDYADEVLVLGAGDGRAMIRSTQSRQSSGKLRRVAVISDSGIGTKAAADSRALQEMAWRNDIDNFSEVVVRNTAAAPLGAVQVGDEIYVAGRMAWNIVDSWVRVLNIKVQPNATQTYSMTVARTNRIG